MEEVKDFFSDLLPEWFSIAFAVLILVFIAVLAVFIIIKVKSGESTVEFLGIKIEPNKAFNSLQKQFNDLNEHSHLKSQILMLLNQTIITNTNWDDCREEEFEERMRNFYSFFFPGIISLVTKQRDNAHRIAVFTLNGTKLKILHGSGYSPGGLVNLSLCLDKSKAGYSYKNNETYYNGDLTKDPSYQRNPKATKEYKSLLCIPILYCNNVIGILNVDGIKANSFDKDDIDYITYFANALAPLLNKENEYRHQKNEKEALLNEQKRSS